jgi:hypothetical protein
MADTGRNGKQDGHRCSQCGAQSDGGAINHAPRCLAIKVIRDSRDFASYMSALMSDLAEGRITPGVGNAICNAGGKLLKVKEMEMRWGTVGSGGKNKVLELAPEDETKKNDDEQDNPEQAAA